MLVLTCLLLYCRWDIQHSPFSIQSWRWQTFTPVWWSSPVYTTHYTRYGNKLCHLHLICTYSPSYCSSSWSWSYGSWIYNYLCNLCISPLNRCEFEFCSWRSVLDTALCDKVCLWFSAGWCFFQLLRFPPSDHQDITEILLNLVLNTIIHPYCSNQRLIVLESGKYIQMERHVCPQTVFSELALYKSNFKKHECSIKYLGKPIYPSILIKMIPILAILDKGHSSSC